MKILVNKYYMIFVNEAKKLWKIFLDLIMKHMNIQ